MEALGIPDEEDIIKKKREKDNMLKDKFNIETFEQKYDRELKKRAEKKKKLEEDKQLREREAYTF
jgi:phosphoglycerate-specific signal transduction histidine kinase